MKLHTRTYPTREAHLALMEHLGRLTEKYELTYGEMMKMLAEAQVAYATAKVREERHGDINKKGDEA